MRAALAALLAFLLLLPGCGDEEAETIRGEGYSYALPGGWQTSASADELVDLALEGSGVGELDVGYDTFAFADPIDGFAPNVNVIVEHGAEGIDAREYTERSRAFFRASASREGFLPSGLTVEQDLSPPRRVQVDGAEAYAYGYSGSAGGRALAFRVITTVRDGRGYTITYTAPADAFEAEAAAFDELLASWRWSG